MSENQLPFLTLKDLQDAVAGATVAMRCVNDLDPAGGPGDKVFPPTYEGAVYARETRVIDGERLPCVLLDSVQSQANRLEMALLEWHRGCPEDDKPFPLVQVDFSDTDAAEAGLLTALEAPHRIVDGIFLACEVFGDGNKRIPFRHPRDPAKGSDYGQRLESASVVNATPIFELCPTALLFGMWDSHGARGGLGEKFQRVLVSEIIGVDAEIGKRPASRIDPLIRTTKDMPIEKSEDGTWRMTERGKSKLSEVGLGNVTPSLVNPDSGKDNHGGVTIGFARQITVLSYSALRRLRFPILKDKRTVESLEINVAARTVLAALGLAAIANQWPDGFSLRSRCDLLPRSRDLRLEILKPGSGDRFVLDRPTAQGLVNTAADKARKLGLPWNKTPLTLHPNAELVKVVKQSREQTKKGG
jgi:CRISPR-associated protein Csb1